MPACKMSSIPTDPWGGLHIMDWIERENDLDDLASVFGNDEDFERKIDPSVFITTTTQLYDPEDFDFNGSYSSEDEFDKYFSSGYRVRNHDCLLGGQCCKREEIERTTVGPVPQHPIPSAPAPVAVPAPAPVHPPTPPSVLITHSANKVVTIVPASERTDSVMVRTVHKTESRSLLLNRTTVNSPAKTPAQAPTIVKRHFPTPQNSRPETPQSEEDLPPIHLPINQHNTTNVFRSALEAISTPQSWEDDAETPSPQSSPSQTDIWRRNCANSDHNYDGSNKNLRLEGLGVETPSDSAEEDEEIDVVSLSERSSKSRSSSCGSGLSTWPTDRDQYHLAKITTSLLSASQAVSRKLKASQQAVRQQQHHSHKRKYPSESSEDDDEEEEEVVEEEDEEDEEEEEQQPPQTLVFKCRQQTKRQKRTPTRRKKNAKFGEEEDSQEKRDLHNNMERMRRIDLKNSFEELRSLIPNLADKERAAKVLILQEATAYCEELRNNSKARSEQVEKLREEQERLRAIVSNMRRAHARAIIAAKHLN